MVPVTVFTTVPLTLTLFVEVIIAEPDVVAIVNVFDDELYVEVLIPATALNVVAKAAAA